MMKKFVISLIPLLFISVLVSSQPNPADTARIRQENIRIAAKTQYVYFVIKTAADQFGYSIYANGNLFIHQTTIPALAGNAGFRDTADAAKMARLVIKKIKEGEMPPSITLADLQRCSINLNKQE